MDEDAPRSRHRRPIALFSWHSCLCDHGEEHWPTLSLFLAPTQQGRMNEWVGVSCVGVGVGTSCGWWFNKGFWPAWSCYTLHMPEFWLWDEVHGGKKGTQLSDSVNDSHLLLLQSLTGRSPGTEKARLTPALHLILCLYSTFEARWLPDYYQEISLGRFNLISYLKIRIAIVGTGTTSLFFLSNKYKFLSTIAIKPKYLSFSSVSQSIFLVIYCVMQLTVVLF